jgi:hypothetical protein
MLAYKMKEVNGKYIIEETETGLEVQKYKEQKAARETLRNLNMGGGFDGFSPTFFTKSIKTK